MMNWDEHCSKPGKAADFSVCVCVGGSECEGQCGELCCVHMFSWHLYAQLSK